jgi:hypothetical protein
MPRADGKSERDQKLADDARLIRAWRRWHRERLEQALTSVHREVLERLMAQVANLRSARELVNHIASENWSIVDADTRAIVLHEINATITALREHMGLNPIDDPLPGQPENALRIVRKLITNSANRG